MSWTHSSKAVALGVLLAVALAMAGTAAAVSFTEEEVTQQAQAGEEVTIEVTMNDLYSDEAGLPDEWTLRAESNLEEPDFTLVVRDAAGNEVARQDNQTASIEQDLSSDANQVTVEIQVVGSVTEPDSYDYDNLGAENVTALQISQVVEGGASPLEGGTWEVHQYTEDSREARQTIDEAQRAVDNASSDDAETRLDEAKTFYDNKEFEQAIEAANDARDTAESESGGLPILPIAGVGVVVLLVVVGLVVYLTGQEDNSSKLQ